MKKLLAFLLLCIVASSAHAELNTPDQRAGTRGALRVRGVSVATAVGTAINVMMPPYNAACDGKTLDNGPFAAALATGQPVYIPPTVNGCVLNNLAVPSFSKIIGQAAPAYTTNGTASRVIPQTGATNVFNVASTNSTLFQNIDVLCATPGTYNTAVRGFSSQSTYMRLIDMSIRYCGNGGVGDNTFATSALFVHNVVFYGNGQANTTAGVMNLVDSQIIGGDFAANQDGIYLPTGSNDNQVTDIKSEFNLGFGINCYQCQHTAVSGGVWDRNYKGAFSLTQAQSFSSAGAMFRRNGRNNSYGQEQDIYFNGNDNGIQIVGFTTDHGKDDNGTNNDTPAYIVLFNANTDTNVVIQGDCSGYSSGGAFLFNASPFTPNPSVTLLCTNPTMVSNIAAGQLAAGTTLPVAFTNTGVAVGNLVDGPNIPQGDTVASFINSAAVTLTTNGTTASGNGTLHFASGGTSCVNGMYIIDTTATTVIPQGTTATGSSATTITMSANATGSGVGSGDTIICYPSITLKTATSSALAPASTNNPQFVHVTPDASSLSSFGSSLFPGGGAFPGSLFVNGVTNTGSLLLNGSQSPLTPGGRLTLTSNTPVMTADSAGATTIYYADYVNDLVPIYNGTNWIEYNLGGQISLTLNTTNMPTTEVFDVYAVNVSGTPTLCAMYWGGNTSRSTSAGGKSGTANASIALKNGIWTNNAAIAASNCYNNTTAYTISQNQGTYLGTFYTTANGQTTMNLAPSSASGGSNNFLGLYNAYNQVEYASVEQDSTVSLSYTTAAWQSMNNNTANRVSFVDGLQQSQITAAMRVGATTTGTIYAGLGLDSTTSPIVPYAGSSTALSMLVPTDYITPKLGFHYIQALQYGGTAATWYLSGNSNYALTVKLRM